MKDNRKINPAINPQDNEKIGEAHKQDKQPARAADRENSRKRHHKESPTLPAKEQIKKTQKAIESLKKTFR